MRYPLFRISCTSTRHLLTIFTLLSAGEYIATATTTLSSDSVAYITPSDYRTIINITFEATHEEVHACPVDGGTARQSDVTAEVLLFSLQRYLEQNADTLDAKTLVQAMLKTVGTPTQHFDFVASGLLSSVNIDAVQLVRRLQAKVLMRPEMVNERFGLLANIALRQASTAKQMSRQVIQRLVTEVTRILEYVSQGGLLSDRIRNIYSILRPKLQLESQPSNIQLELRASIETCRICDESILFESVKWAKCGSGHQFSRCALTFLAIQEPNISKQCGVCGAQCLNEWKLPELRGSKEGEDVEMTDPSLEGIAAPGSSVGDQLQNGVTAGEQESGDYQDAAAGLAQVKNNGKPAIEPPSSLARILFAAFDTCIYCGGKFVA